MQLTLNRLIGLIVAAGTLTLGCSSHHRPTKTDPRLSAAGAALRAADPATALKELGDCDSLDCREMRGLALWIHAKMTRASGDFGEARATLESTVEEGRKRGELDPAWLSNLVAFYVGTHDYPAAEALIPIAKTPAALETFAEMRIDQNRCEDAVAFAQTASEVSPHDCNAWTALARSQDCAGRAKEGLDALKHALADACALDGNAYYLAGALTEKETGDRQLAEPYYRRATELAPGDCAGTAAGRRLGGIGK